MGIRSTLAGLLALAGLGGRANKETKRAGPWPEAKDHLYGFNGAHDFREERRGRNYRADKAKKRRRKQVQASQRRNRR